MSISTVVEPISQPASATADATGKATLAVNTLRGSMWSSVTYIGTAVTTSASLTVKLTSALQLLATGASRDINLGPARIAPGQDVTITITGLNPGDTVSGSFVGSAAFDPALLPTQSPQSSGSTEINAGTVTITGPVSISGTVTVSVSNTPSVVVSNSQLQVTNSGGGSLTVAGTVNIGNTPAVTISGTPTVNVGTISGSVTISAGTVNVQNVTNGILQTALAPTSITSYSAPSGVSTSSQITLPANVTQLMVQWASTASLPGSGTTTFKCTGVTTGTNYFNALQGMFISTQDFNGFITKAISPQDAKVTITTQFAGTTTVYVTALLTPGSPTIQQVSGSIGGQPVNVQPTSGANGGTATTIVLNNSVPTGAGLNITASTANIRGIQFGWLSATVGTSTGFTSFGGSPIGLAQYGLGVAANSLPTSNTYRITANSGYKLTTSTIYTVQGCMYQDTDQ